MRTDSDQLLHEPKSPARREVWIDIGIVLVLLVIGGLFTATELALVTSRSGQLEAIAQRGSRGARVARLAHEPTRYLAAVQIGSIVAGFFAAAFGADAASRACSLVPVIDGSTENIIGFVHVRDLLDPAHRGRPVTLGEIVRGMKVFPAMKHLLPTLSEMQAAGAHIAMVVDEYCAIARVVTVENLVEKLVGDIYDEYDTVPSPPHSIESGLGEMDGLISLGEFRQRTGVGLPVGPYGTVGGLVVALLGRVPAVGDEVEVAGHRLAVTAVQGRRVERVLVSRAEHP